MFLPLPQNETEWQSFLRQSLEYVAKVAKLFPLHAFSQLVPLLESYSSVYLSLAHLISRSGDCELTNTNLIT